MLRQQPNSPRGSSSTRDFITFILQFKIPDLKIKSQGPFQHNDITFQPLRKSLPQEQGTVIL